MGRLRIVATECVPAAAHTAFSDLGAIVLDDASDPTILTDADVLIVRTRLVDGALLDGMSRLRAIARTGVGLDSIDLDEATKRKVPVLYAPEAGVAPIAEGTLALIFATAKRLRELSAMVEGGRWGERYQCDVRDLAGATLGIVGLGRIGCEVARLASAIGMVVIGYDPRLDSPSGSDVRRVDLDELVREADIVSLHCALNDSSRGMIDRKLLGRAKPGAILINAARGGLIASDDVLVEALDRGWLSAVGLDVFASEPPEVGSRLLGDERVICTPHAIGLTRAWNDRVFGSLAEDVRRVLNGGRPQFVANPEIL
jgi:D-3-phosphoglycerate dehydrogenase